jgi:putative aminopeptidase FrvX
VEVVWVGNKNEEIVERSAANNPRHLDMQRVVALDACNLAGLSGTAWVAE